MLKHLALRGVGPAPSLDLDLGPRVNLLTGDNGLGKTFLLDIAWWALTGSWADEPAWPQQGAKSPGIMWRTTNVDEIGEQFSLFDLKNQRWPGSASPPESNRSAGLVLYAAIDGSFSVWDPVRNSYWQSSVIDLTRPKSYLFTKEEVWLGKRKNGHVLCRGLIDDWVLWQTGDNEAFQLLCRVLEKLSSGEGEILRPGAPTRLRIGEATAIPTLQMPYGEVPVTLASAGMKRIVALAYILVWSWSEYRYAAELADEAPTNQITLLVDELEAHLHPKWQRAILPALQTAATILEDSQDLQVQILATTHSPLILASLEPTFEEAQDGVLLFELEEGSVRLSELPWTKQGDAVGWLTSEVFGLKQARSREAERTIEAAEAWMRGDTAELPKDLPDSDAIHRELLRVLAGHDPFWPRWVVHREEETA